MVQIPLRIKEEMWMHSKRKISSIDDLILSKYQRPAATKHASCSIFQQSVFKANPFKESGEDINKEKEQGCWHQQNRIDKNWIKSRHHQRGVWWIPTKSVRQFWSLFLQRQTRKHSTSTFRKYGSAFGEPNVCADHLQFITPFMNLRQIQIKERRLTVVMDSQSQRRRAQTGRCLSVVVSIKSVPTLHWCCWLAADSKKR